MAVSEEQFGEWLESLEQTLSDGNIEEYLTANPGDAGTWIDWPDPTYAQHLAANLLLFRAILAAEGAFAGSGIDEVVTTGSIGAEEGRATITFDEMVTPVVTASVLDPLHDGIVHHVALQAVSSTSATIRVLRTTTVTISGFEVFALPQLAAGVTVHISVRDAG